MITIRPDAIYPSRMRCLAVKTSMHPPTMLKIVNPLIILSMPDRIIVSFSLPFSFFFLGGGSGGMPEPPCWDFFNF